MKNTATANIAADSPSQESSAAALARLGLPAEALPRHIAIIMDGNGRWAQQRGMAREVGHQQGATAVRAIVTECARLKLQVLTLYTFSSENWKRPHDEIDFLMSLCVDFLVAEREVMMANNVRLLQVGRREGLAPRVLHELDETMRITGGNTGLKLVLALNYGSRTEITDAVRVIAKEVKEGRLDPGAISERTIADHLYTAGLPDPDLLVRTAGEMRLSNYLLWQISYAELYVAEVCWPDFGVEELYKAMREYARRTRKFGAVVR